MKIDYDALVSFRFFKRAMDVRTDKAQLIKLGSVNDPIKVWLPLSQITIDNDCEDNDYYVVTLPYWLFSKHSILMDFTNPHIVG